MPICTVYLLLLRFHCTVCPSSVDGFLLSTWHFRTFLNWINTNEQIHSLTNQLSWEQCYRLLMNLKLSPFEFESRLLRGVIDTLICEGDKETQIVHRIIHRIPWIWLNIEYEPSWSGKVSVICSTSGSHHTQIMLIKYGPSYTQLEENTNRTLFMRKS
jgi:hypothetical protein